MRRNCTWDTDVKLFAATLLFPTDIWCLVQIMGKWKVFSGMGANLIEALESIPVNSAGTINLNHN